MLQNATEASIVYSNRGIVFRQGTEGGTSFYRHSLNRPVLQRIKILLHRAATRSSSVRSTPHPYYASAALTCDNDLAAWRTSLFCLSAVRHCYGASLQYGYYSSRALLRS